MLCYLLDEPKTNIPLLLLYPLTISHLTFQKLHMSGYILVLLDIELHIIDIIYTWQKRNHIQTTGR